MRLGGILFEGDTDYNHYSVQDMFYLGRPARVLFSGAHDAAQSGIPLDGRKGMLFDYNQCFMDIVCGMKPASVLILGGGAFTLPAALRQAFPDMEITVVELDGGLVAIAKRFFDFDPDGDEKMHVIIGDARKYLDTADRSFDAVVVDVFTHSTIPEPFQTIETVQALKSRLNKQGVMAMNIIASQEGRRSPLLYRMYQRVKAVFPDVSVFPANRRLSPWISQNYVITATDSATSGISAMVGYAAVDLEA